MSGVPWYSFTIEFVDGRRGSGDARQRHWKGSISGQSRDVSRHGGIGMANYIPSPRDWVREQVELYESSGGTQGTTLRDTGLPVAIITNRASGIGKLSKTPLMRVE